MKKFLALIMLGVILMSTAEATPLKRFKLSEEEVKKYQDTIVEIKTNKGIVVLELYPDKAPGTVASFVSLIEKDFYDGLTFHRVIPRFVVQGGDPKGNGTGGPGYRIKAEFNDVPHKTGTLSMARSQHPDSAGSQFYICLAPQPHLDGSYTVFGQVVDGMDIVELIKRGDKIENISLIPKKYEKK